MARTIIGLNDPKAVKKYSAFLAVDSPKHSFFTSKLMGEGVDSGMPITRLTELESDAGDTITYDLSMQLKQQPIEGDNVQEGTEEDLTFYTDQVWIDQMRAGVNTGGKMTRKRTLHDLRKIGRKRQAEWWGRVFDEILFIYLSGARGVNAGYLLPTSWTGRANNALSAPDADHLVMPGATVKATLAATDTMSTTVIDKALAVADMMGGETTEIPSIQPIKINGEDRYVMVMNPWQARDLRADTGGTGWLEIQKSLAAAVGEKSPIVKGGLGMHNGVVLQQHKGGIRFSDYGSGGNVAAARALFLGEQAGGVAFGSPGTGFRFDWYEESRDNGNQAVISTSCIWGCKKTTFNGIDFGIMAVDTAAKA
jgi:N4-gp56 family major capsid protein